MIIHSHVSSPPPLAISIVPYSPYLVPLNLPKPVFGQLFIQLSRVGGWHPVDVTLSEEALLLIPHSTTVFNHLRMGKVFCSHGEAYMANCLQADMWVFSFAHYLTPTGFRPA